MKYLVSGATGFIGRHWVAHLLSAGATVYGLCRTPPPWDHPNFHSLQVDLATPGWSTVLPEAVDIVVHLAQSKRYREFPDGALDMVRINIDATFELLEWSRQHQVTQFLFTSTGNVYKPSQVLLTEAAECQPVSMYSATKLSAEHLVQQYAKFFAVRIVRLFGVYGPQQRDMIIPSMIERVRTGQEITLAQGIGLSFTPLFITDCLTMLTDLLMEKQSNNSTTLFNLAGSEIIQLCDVVRQVANFYGVQANTRQTEASPSYLQGDNTKIVTELGYGPGVQFADGLIQVLESYKNTNDHAR